MRAVATTLLLTLLAYTIPLCVLFAAPLPPQQPQEGDSVWYQGVAHSTWYRGTCPINTGSSKPYATHYVDPVTMQALTDCIPELPTLSPW